MALFLLPHYPGGSERAKGQFLRSCHRRCSVEWKTEQAIAAPVRSPKYRATEHLVDLRFVDGKVGSSGYPTGQQDSYSNTPPNCGPFLNASTIDSLRGARSLFCGSATPY